MGHKEGTVRFIGMLLIASLVLSQVQASSQASGAGSAPPPDLEEGQTAKFAIGITSEIYRVLEIRGRWIKVAWKDNLLWINSDQILMQDLTP